MTQLCEDELVVKYARDPAEDWLFVVALEIEVLARKSISDAEKQHGDARKNHATKRRGRSGIVLVCVGQQPGHRAAGDARIWKLLARKPLGRKNSAAEAIYRDDMGPSLNPSLREPLAWLQRRMHCIAEPAGKQFLQGGQRRWYLL